MGWMRTLLLGDIGNRLDIEDTERNISKLRVYLRSKAATDSGQNERLDALEEENEQLKLSMATLIQMLVKRKLLSESDLEALVDLNDPETDEA
jgi:hypothetical protein